MKATAGGSGGRSMLPVLLGCSFAASFSQSMMNIALPELAHEFSVTLSMANWLVVGYQVVAATAVTLAAFLLKRFGLRTVFFVGGVCIGGGKRIGRIRSQLPDSVLLPVGAGDLLGALLSCRYERHHDGFS